MKTMLAVLLLLVPVAAHAQCTGEEALVRSRHIRSLVRDLDTSEALWIADAGTVLTGNRSATGAGFYILGRELQGYEPCPGVAGMKSYDLSATSGEISLSWISPANGIAVRAFVLGAGDHLRGTTEQGEEQMEANTFTSSMNGVSLRYRNWVSLTYGNFSLKDRHYLRIGSPYAGGAHLDIVDDERATTFWRAGVPAIRVWKDARFGASVEHRKGETIVEPRFQRVMVVTEDWHRTVSVIGGSRIDGGPAFESVRVRGDASLPFFDAGGYARLGAFAEASVWNRDDVLPGASVGLDLFLSVRNVGIGVLVDAGFNEVDVLRDLPEARNHPQESGLLYCRASF